MIKGCKKWTGLPCKALMLAGACHIIFGSTAVAAQSSETAQSESSWSDGDIIVTAQKRGENVQDVPFAITAFGGEALRELGMMSTTDIVTQVPSIRVSQFSPTVSVINIRGVSQNDFADHLEGPVAVYIDEAYVSSMGAISGQLFDLERVEVLRGPQGILFGRNATGGLIHYVSKKPSGRTEGYIEATAMTFGYGRIEAAIGGPIAKDVSGRIAVAGLRHSGYLKNRIGRDAQDARNYAARAQLQFDLSPDVDVLVKGHYSLNDNETAGAAYSHRVGKPGTDGLGEFVGDNENYWGACAGCDQAGYKETDGNPLSEAFDYPGRFNRTIYGSTVTLNANLGFADLTSITDYMHIKKRFTEDVDSSPNPVLNYGTFQNYDQFSQELRIAGESHSLNWITGAYFIAMDGDQTIDTDLLISSYSTDVAYRLKSKSYALFAHGEYHFMPTLSLTLGARYTWDDREMDYNLTDNAGSNISFNPVTHPDLASQSWKNLSAKVSLNWKASDDVLLFASVNRGHKAGNFAAPVFPPIVPQNLPHDQEVLTSFEIGTKATILDGLARINASLFYYDYDDYQSFTLQNFVTTIGNRDAIVKGAELELALRPTQGLNINFNASLLNSKVKGVVLPSGRVVDRKLPLAPDFSFSGLLRYEWASFGGTVAVQTDFSYTDAFSFTVLSAPVEREEGYFLGNARISFKPSDGPLELAAFVKNFTDKRYRAFALDLSSVGMVEERYAPPRWWGGSISYRW